MKNMICPVCRNEEHLKNAKFCMICGAPLDSCEGCVNEQASRDQDCCWNCKRNGKRTRTDLYKKILVDKN